MERIAFNTSRKSPSIGRPAFDAPGRKGSIRAHSSSVKSLGYRLVFFSILAIRPRVAGVHIPSLNHARKTLSTSFQTDSKLLGIVLGFSAVILPPIGAFGIVAVPGLVLLWVM